MRRMRNMYRKLMWRDHFEELRIDSRILINVCVCEDVDWIQLA
jgi:hypothetical protein